MRSARRAVLALSFGACAIATAIPVLVPAAREESSVSRAGRTALASALSVPWVVEWDAKNAYTKCALAIDGWLSWPSRKDAACAAMRMCANEASLSAARDRRLSARMRTSGCAAP